MKLSVILCTHNPRELYLRRVLGALSSQTLSKNQWELLFVDNASNDILSEKWDIGWHPFSRHVRESKLGLTPARIAGISLAQGQLIVLVDDDNVLCENYLSECLRVFEEYPFIGAWGGRVIGEFESPPPEYAIPYLDNLAIRDVADVRWGFGPGFDAVAFAPCGAGMCIRREVALDHLRVLSSRSGQTLDRKGSDLLSAGDTDLALHSCDLGLGVGVFPVLEVRHLIPSARLSKDYLISLHRSIHFSLCWLEMLRGKKTERPGVSRIGLRKIIAEGDRLFKKMIRYGDESYWFRDSMSRAAEEGRRQAIRGWWESLTKKF